MRLRIVLSIMIAAMTLQLNALDVTNTAGSLNQAVTDLGITTLKVTGTMDANDFYFMADNLRRLVDVDLSGVTVVAGRTVAARYGKQNFDADELPIGTFASMPVTRVVLPTSLKRINEAAFMDCDRLARIDLPSSLEVIGNYAFAHCTALTSVTLPASVVKVERGAFMRCYALTSLAVAPSSQLMALGDDALMDCPALTSVNLGNAIKTIGNRAMAGTGLKALDLKASSSLVELGNWALTMTPVTSVSLPTSLQRVGAGAFLYDKGLKTINPGQGLTTMGDYALAGTSLQGKLTLDGLKTLGDYALYNIQALTAVELPATTEHLGTQSMAGMTGLTELTSKAEVPPTLGEQVWAGIIQANIPLSVPKGSIDLYRAASQWQQFLFPKQWIKGDVNNDGSVNISDINVIVSIILGAKVDSDTMQRADVNEDGTVNISDVNLLLNMILNPSHNVMLDVNTQDQLHLPDVNVMAGEQTAVPVTLDNASEYSALQCDIKLPAGVTLVSCQAPEGYVLHSSPVDASTTRIAIYSPQTRHFDHEKPVFTMTLSTDAPLPDESQMLLTQAVIAGGFEGWHPADCAAMVSYSSHVQEVSASDCRVWVENRTLCIQASQTMTAMLSTMGGIARQLTLMQGVNRYDLEPGFYVIVTGGRSHKIAIQ